MLRSVFPSVYLGDWRQWTLADARAVLALARYDLEHVLARLVLDRTGSLGEAVETEVLFRQAIREARATDTRGFGGNRFILDEMVRRSRFPS